MSRLGEYYRFEVGSPTNDDHLKVEVDSCYAIIGQMRGGKRHSRRIIVNMLVVRPKEVVSQDGGPSIIEITPYREERLREVVTTNHPIIYHRLDTMVAVERLFPTNIHFHLGITLIGFQNNWPLEEQLEDFYICVARKRRPWFITFFKLVPCDD